MEYVAESFPIFARLRVIVLFEPSNTTRLGVTSRFPWAIVLNGIKKVRARKLKSAGKRNPFPNSLGSFLLSTD